MEKVIIIKRCLDIIASLGKARASKVDMPMLLLEYPSEHPFVTRNKCRALGWGAPTVVMGPLTWLYSHQKKSWATI